MNQFALLGVWLWPALVLCPDMLLPARSPKDKSARLGEQDDKHASWYATQRLTGREPGMQAGEDE